MDKAVDEMRGGPRQAPDGAADTPGAASRTGRAGAVLPEWEAAIAPGARCLNPTSARYRIRARNPARAALAALHRHGMTGEQARGWGMCIAVHLLPDTAHPRAVFALDGPAGEPMLRLRYARLLPGTSELLTGRDSPFDESAVAREVPKTARRWAQARVGSSGIAEVMRGIFWQREATLYCATALVLSAFGFPMSVEVFAVGGILLLLQGAVRLLVHESRILALTRAFLRNPAHASELRQDSQRMLFLRGHDLLGVTGRQVRKILREQAAIPDLAGRSRLMLLIDEDAVVTTGAGAYGIVPEETLPESENVLTVVFRRPKRPDITAPPSEPPTAQEGSASAGETPPPQGSGNLPARRPQVAVDVEEVEVIEAELLDPEAYYDGQPARNWWA
ncbi:hypothetical protein [Rhodovibrio salinarum]|uniref:Uncharacterized protein n=1 Tax=Rhodovibrio salinarum TaxID=1087 RepID=A0A934QJC4_9PROT|nr:hypothetical protein [Rhodovibrio salinarum]MBK1697954.1 hypothetical protein [Rhodovibrio salinarum]